MTQKKKNLYTEIQLYLFSITCTVPTQVKSNIAKNTNENKKATHVNVV